MAVVDAVSNDDLLRLGPALKGMPLVTAGSGVAIGLPANFGLAPSPQASALAAGHRAAGGGVGQLLAGDQPAGRALHRGGPPRASRSIRCGWRPATTWRPQALAWAAPLAGERAGAGLFHGRARRGEVGAGAARRGGGRRAGRARPGRHRARPGRARRAPARGGRRRDLGRRACRRWASRRCRSARRSTPACPGAMPSTLRERRPAPGAEVRQLRHRRLLHQSLYRAAHDRIASPRRNLPRRPACSSAATCTPRPATSACGCDDGFLITPTDACLGFLDPARLARLDADGQQTRWRPRQQDPRAAPPDLRAPPPRSTPPPAASSTPTARTGGADAAPGRGR